MRILVVSSLWPTKIHTTRAANIVFYELINELVK